MEEIKSIHPSTIAPALLAKARAHATDADDDLAGAAFLLAHWLRVRRVCHPVQPWAAQTDVDAMPGDAVAGIARLLLSAERNLCEAHETIEDVEHNADHLMHAMTLCAGLAALLADCIEACNALSKPDKALTPTSGTVALMTIATARDWLHKSPTYMEQCEPVAAVAQ